MDSNESTPLQERRVSIHYDTKMAFWVRFVVYLSCFGEGYFVGVFSGVGVRVQEEFGLRGDQLGSLFGVFYLSLGFGMLVSGRIADWIGRIPALFFSHSFLLGAVIAVTLAQNYLTLVIGQVCIGIGCGMGLATEVMYISETSPASERGMLGGCVEFSHNFGIVFGFAANYFLLGVKNDWRIMIALGGLSPLIALIFIMLGFVPESPRYLLLTGKNAEAKERLHTLLSSSQEAEETFAMWEDEPEEMEGFGGLFKSKERIRMCLAGFGAGLAQMSGGICVVTSMSSYLMEQAGYAQKDAFSATLVMGVVKTLSISIAVFWMVDTYGRRPLLIGSAAGMTVTSFAIGASFQHRVAMSTLQLSFSALVIVFSLGLGPVGYIYTGEVFDSPVRGAGTSFSLFMGRSLNGAMCWYIAPFTKNSIEHIALVFYVFGGINAFFTFFMYVYCPETKQQKLEEMQRVFRHSLKNGVSGVVASKV